MSTERTFAGEAASVASARSFVATAVGDVAPDDLQSITLMVSELATNSVRHAQSSFRVEVERTDHRVRVAVHDRGDGTPEVQAPTADRPSGRGLHIVEVLADDWGVEQGPGGAKAVWFSLGLTAGAPAPR
jgi:anti-sigma regulatory factor (Ser/Thr protein kinase)